MTGVGQQIKTAVNAAGLSGRTGKCAITVQAIGSGGTGIIAIPAIVVVSPPVNTGIIAGKPVSSAEDRLCNLNRGLEGGDRCFGNNRGGCDEWFCCR
jgi:hypothetical protein